MLQHVTVLMIEVGPANVELHVIQKNRDLIQNQELNTTIHCSFKLIRVNNVNYYSGIKREKGPMYYFLR